jgi:hypothetical protein
MTSWLGKLKALVFHKLQNCFYCRIAKLFGNLPLPCCCPVKKCMINFICSCVHVIIELFVVSVSILAELARLFIYMCTRGQICNDVYVVLCVQRANFQSVVYNFVCPRPQICNQLIVVCPSWTSSLCPFSLDACLYSKLKK